MDTDSQIINFEDSPYSNDDETKGFELSSGKNWYYPINYPVREYQYKIAEASLFNNTLVCLPTGLGKTFIAAVVMYNFSRWYPKGKVVFMAPTRPLVAQQIHACHDVMGIPSDQTVELTGSINQNKRLDAWIKKRVIFATPQVFQNDLQKKLVPYNEVKCVVIDEAHRALGNHAYSEAIRLLSEHNTYFRVLALSATPGNSLDKVREVVQKLRISNLELRDETSSDIVPYVNERRIDIILVCLSKELQGFKDRYIQIMDPHVKILINYKVLTGATANITKGRIFMLMKTRQDYQRNNNQRNENPIIMKTLVLLLTMTHAYELMQKHGLRAFYNFYRNHSDKPWYGNETHLHRLLEEIKEYLRDFPDVLSLPNGVVPEIPSNIVFGHSKFIKLKSLLQDHFENARSDNKDTRSIVFVEFKDSVREVYVLLLQCRPLIRPQMFVGQSDQKQKHQNQALEDFRNNKVNVLISTSVGEEGLDVGEVDLIVCFDGCQKNSSRLVQRMGRTGRKRNGHIYILVTDGKEYKDLKMTLNKKDTFNNKVMQSSNIVSSMYDANPRMVPKNFNPVCRQIRFETQPKTPKVDKKQKKAPVQKKAPAEKKARTRPGRKSKNFEPPAEGTSSESNKFSMNKFLTKKVPTEKEKVIPVRCIDDKIKQSNDVKLLTNDDMGLEFLTLMTMKNSKAVPETREMEILKYIPELEEEGDFVLTQFYSPPLDILQNMKSWRRDEVSMLWNTCVVSEDEDDHSNLTYDNNYSQLQYSYSQAIIIQSPNLKYNRNDDAFNSRFLGDDAFDQITDFSEMNSESNVLVPTKSTEKSLLEDEAFDQINDFSEMNSESNVSALVRRSTEKGPLDDDLFDQSTDFSKKNTESNFSASMRSTEGNLLEDNLDSQFVSIFDEILQSSDEETDHPEPSAEKTIKEKIEEKINESGGLFDDLLNTSSEDDNSKGPVLEISQPGSKNDPVSQALMEIRTMSLEQSHNEEIQLQQNKQASPAKDKTLSEVIFSIHSQVSRQSQNSRRKIVHDSDEDMFIDDVSSDDEPPKSIGISGVPYTITESVSMIEDPDLSLPQRYPVPSQRPSTLSLRLQPKEPLVTQKPKMEEKRSKLSITKRPIEINDDFDDAFNQIPFNSKKEPEKASKRIKLSLNTQTSKPNVSSSNRFASNSFTSKSSSRQNDSNIENRWWEDEPQPGPSRNFSANKFCSTPKNNKANLKSFSTKNKKPQQTSLTNFFKPLLVSQKTQTTTTISSDSEDDFVQPKLPTFKQKFDKKETKVKEKITNHRLSMSTKPSSVSQNQKSSKISSDSDDDVFVRPKMPNQKKKTKVMEKVNHRLITSSSYYGSPSRKDYLKKRRKEKQKKSPKIANDFIEEQAEVASDFDTSDGSSGSDEESEEMASFISHSQYLDETNAMYLKSIRSPKNQKFLIKQKQNYLPKALVCSQAFTQEVDEYVEDTFCVIEDEDDEFADFITDDEQVEENSSVDELEKQEQILEERRKKRKREKSNSSRPCKKKKEKRTIEISSDSEDELEFLRKQTAEESMQLKKRQTR